MAFFNQYYVNNGRKLFDNYKLQKNDIKSKSMYNCLQTTIEYTLFHLAKQLPYLESYAGAPDIPCK